MSADRIFKYCKFDIEYGNSVGFFSGTKSLTYDFKTQQSEYEKNLLGKLDKTRIKVKDRVQSNFEGIHRSTDFIAHDDSLLFDLVSRFVVWTSLPCAKINSNLYTHESKNLYYQFDVVENSSVEIDVSEGQLIFKPVKIFPPKGFKQVIYIRDEQQENGLYKWVVHHRLIVDEHQSNMILRCCHPRFEGVVAAQNCIPKFIKRKFYRIRETKYPNCPFMTVGESTLKKDQVVSLKTRIVYEND